MTTINKVKTIVLDPILFRRTAKKSISSASKLTVNGYTKEMEQKILEMRNDTKGEKVYNDMKEFWKDVESA